MSDAQREIDASLAFVRAQVRALGSVVTPGGNQLEHALRTAETLRRRQADPLVVAAGLLHDIGKTEDLPRHPEIGAVRLNGRVHPDVVWLVRWHVVAQRITRVPDPLRSQLQAHPRFADLLALIAAEVQPDPVDLLPPLEAFDAAVRSILLGADGKRDAMIHGVQVKPLAMNLDNRGCFTEIFDDSWGLPIRPAQWSLVASGQRVLRGMHLHLRHDEYFLVVRGRACVGLYDLRVDSPTAGVSRLLEFSGEQLCALVFPAGILHGWYFYEESLHLQSVSESYTTYHHDDNLGCLWSDPELKLPWPDPTPLLSDRAKSFPTLAQLTASLGRVTGGAQQ